MSAGHARLGPSNHRWPHCPGSVREEEKYPDIAGAPAIDGTGSHLLLEYCLVNNVRADAYIGQIIGENHEDCPNGWVIHADRCDRVQMCLDYISARVAHFKKNWPASSIIVEAESRSDPGKHYGREDWNGTCDITIKVIDEGCCISLETIDYKDGRSWVNAKENSQLEGYLGGKLLDETPSGTGIIGCRMTIVQPRTNPVVRYEDVMSSFFKPRLDALAVAAARTDDENAPLIPGKHCSWCKHGRAKNCNAAAEQAIERIEHMTENVTSEGGSLFEIVSQTFGDIEQLESGKLTELADAEAGLMAIFAKVKEEIQRRIVDLEQDVPGYAMLPGNATRKWSEDDKAMEKLLKARRLKLGDIYPKKLLSPAQVEKSDKLTKDQIKRIIDQYVTEVPGKLRLTKVERKAKETPDDMFAGAGTAATAPVSFM